MQRHMKNSFAFYLIALFAALAFMSVCCPAAEAPWERRYKIKPEQKDRLTAADVVSPDGIVYPNWTKCGVQGGTTRAALSLSTGERARSKFLLSVW